MRNWIAAILVTVLIHGVAAMRASAETPDPGTVFPQPAFTAEQFVNFIGINASPFEKYITGRDGKGSGTKYPPEVFYDLGVRHYRMALKTGRTREDAPQLVRTAFDQHGVRPAMLLNLAAGTPEQLVESLKAYGGSEVIGAIEGPNEVNNKFPPQELDLKYGKKRDEAAGSLYMQDYYKAIKDDPQTRDIPVINFTAIFTDYRLAKPCDAFDFNNMHSYQGYRVPSSSLLKNFISANNILPIGGVIKPFMPTECGYNIEEDKSNQIKGNGSPKAQALNDPMLLAEYFRHGFIKRTYLFGLHNADGYGLLESDQETKRPAYFAIQSLIAALKDATWNPQTKKWEGGQFAPRALLFTVDGAPQTLKSVTLQKQSGEYSLLMWNELPTWDSSAKRNIDNPPAKVTLNFMTPVQGKVIVLRQGETGGAFKPAEELTVENGKVTLSVPAAVIIVRVTPQQYGPSAELAPPQQVEADATENSVALTWQAPLAADLAGYFVYRNGWCIGSVPASRRSFEDPSSWIRPGLGYTYEVQAYDRLGNMSPRVTKIAQTPAKFPDLVLTDFGLEKDARPGESVRFRARIKNVGDGATPNGITINASFRVDDQFIAWSGDEVVLKPGEEREYISNGGPKGTPLWTATEGTHTLSVALDDINRIPGEKSKNNNFVDRTIIVGSTPGGLLLGSSAASSREIDLTAEGSEDWVHWGGPTAVNRKTGADRIGELTTTGAAKLSATPGGAICCVWSNGQPTPSNEGTHASVWINGAGNGYAFTAPADKDERVLRVYVSGVGGPSCSLTATLSDNSAPPYVSKTWTGNTGHGNWAPVPGEFVAVYTIRYRANSDHQTLKIDLKLDADANRFQGQIRLSAATLSKAAPK